MSPQDRQRIKQLEKKVNSLMLGQDVAFIQSLVRRLQPELNIPKRLSDLLDVSETDDATTGQVLKKTATTWQPGTDNTA